MTAANDASVKLPEFTKNDLPGLSSELREAEKRLEIEERAIECRRAHIEWLREQIRLVVTP